MMKVYSYLSCLLQKYLQVSCRAFVYTNSIALQNLWLKELKMVNEWQDTEENRI